MTDLLWPGADAAPAASEHDGYNLMGWVQAGLRSALEEERLIAAKISTELAVAAEIQSGMLVPRGAIQVTTRRRR